MNSADAQQAAGTLLTLAWMLALAAVYAPRIGLVAVGPQRTGEVEHVPRPALWGLGAAVLLFTTQAGVVDAIADAPGRITAADRPVLAWMVAHRTPEATAVMHAVSNWGGTVPTLALAAAATAVLLVLRRWSDAVAVVVATAGVPVLVNAFKDLYGRVRPPVETRLAVEPDLSLPSGHALGATVIIGIVAAVVVRSLRSTAGRVAVLAAAVAAVGVISLSRLYLGVHWATDVLTSWTLGGAWLALCVTGLACLTRRRSGRGSGHQPGQ
ncbi:phosphatase PAP2 family protein [Pseudonocardia nematodicida]|uniref:Phosphatase PAP2 family protein n=1 Tax=Pseudonocardia nematodicida TaxID=1206997 RepID=A0ABV1KBT1_9PSEU